MSIVQRGEILAAEPICPEVIRAVGGSSPSTLRAVTVLPEPLSPTTAVRDPSSRLMVTPRRA